MIEKYIKDGLKIEDLVSLGDAVKKQDDLRTLFDPVKMAKGLNPEVFEKGLLFLFEVDTLSGIKLKKTSVLGSHDQEDL